MSIQILNAAIPAAQATAMNTAMDSVISALKGVAVVNLTPDERKALNSIDEVRYTYVDKAINVHSANPACVPSFASVTDAKMDWKLQEDLKPLVLKAIGIVEMMSDMKLLAEHESYQFLLDMYANVQQASKRNVPGIDTVVADLAPLFELTTPPTPPTP